MTEYVLPHPFMFPRSLQKTLALQMGLLAGTLIESLPLAVPVQAARHPAVRAWYKIQPISILVIFLSPQ